jgi:hypothetical protein
MDPTAHGVGMPTPTKPEQTVVIGAGGVVEHWLGGELHRDDGPAVIIPDGVNWIEPKTLGLLKGPAEAYFDDGLLHRTDGPAVIGPGTSRRWCFRGRIYPNRQRWLEAACQSR